MTIDRLDRPGTSSGDRAVPLHDRVYRQIARWLTSGAFPPDSLLTIRTLAARLGTSPMPVRAALSRLVAVRALVNGPHRSFRVPPLTGERLTEIAQVRAALEGLATELATPRLIDREIDRLSRLNQHMSEAAQARDRPEYFKNNYEFHWTIYEGSGQKLLAQMIEDLWLQNGPNEHFPYHDFTIFEEAVSRHRRIIDALQRRDAAAARTALVIDILSANDYVVANLSTLSREAEDQQRRRTARKRAASA